MIDEVTVTDNPPREVRTMRDTARGPGYGAVSRRRFDAPIEDVWQLFVQPDRLGLWYPESVTGDFRLGGEFSIENNASGRILRCEPPRLFWVSWIYEGHYSELEVRLDSVAGGATLVGFEHLMRVEDLADAGMDLGEGLVAAGAGWDLTLEYLGRYLRRELQGSPAAQDDRELAAEDEKRYRESEKLWQAVVKETLDERQ